MLKRLLIAFISILLALGLFACKDETTTANQTTGQTTTQTTTTIPISTVPPTTNTTFLYTGEPSFSFVYDKVVGTGLEIDLKDNGLDIWLIMTYSGTEFAPEWASYGNDVVTVESAYLVELPLGDNNFLLYTSGGIVELVIAITDTRKPAITSLTSVTYTMDEDLTFTFEPYAGAFWKISGNDITEADYVSEENTFTVDFDYIHGKFVESPSRTTLILQVWFTYPEGAVASFVFIYKP